MSHTYASIEVDVYTDESDITMSRRIDNMVAETVNGRLQDGADGPRWVLTVTEYGGATGRGLGIAESRDEATARLFTHLVNTAAHANNGHGA
jgi:hypothetical protein